MTRASLCRAIFSTITSKGEQAAGSDWDLVCKSYFKRSIKPVEKRYKTLDESLQQFPYVDGALFLRTCPLLRSLPSCEQPSGLLRRQ